MKVRLKLKPGQRGTKSLTKQYGDKLVCVHYRDDEKTAKRYTTIELIVAEEPWQPPVLVKPDDLVLLKIAFSEKELQQKVKDAGATWSKSRKMWKLPYKIVCQMKLEKRIVVENEREMQIREKGENINQEAAAKKP
jgi:predicted RNA-binding protein with PIN domain